jgi:hypothetical protein
MEFLAALASLAQQHPSTPLTLEIEFLPDDQSWEASIELRLYESQGEYVPVGIGCGPTAEDALTDLLTILQRAPIR